jgi:DNA-3-methyladenine glycosylase II
MLVDGQTYRRLVGDTRCPALLEVTQSASDALLIRVEGEAPPDVATLAGRMLGAGVELTHFYEAVADFPWLARLAHAARGVKPPRYPSVWEALVNAVVFQQVSIHAAAAILRRVVERYEPARVIGGIALAAFPQPHVIVEADPLDLRALGLSANKVVALRTLGRAILDGELASTRLDALTTEELVARLATFKGIGPWTAAVVALRGFGRLDIFPMNDSGVARSLKDLSGESDIDASAILARLGRQRGMLYYHLLLGRLAARGDIALAQGISPVRTGGSA